MANTPSIPELIEDLTSTDRLVRNSAIWELRDCGQTAREAVPELLKLLGVETDSHIRLGAAGAICRIDPNEAEALLPILMAGLHDNDFMNRDTACMFVGGIGPKAHAAIPTLLNLLDDETETVRCSASEAVGRVSGNWSHAIEIGLTLIQNSDSLIRIVGAEHFEALGVEAKAALPRLRELLAAVEWELRLDVEEVVADIEAL